MYVFCCQNRMSIECAHINKLLLIIEYNIQWNNKTSCEVVLERSFIITKYSSEIDSVTAYSLWVLILAHQTHMQYTTMVERHNKPHSDC